MITALANKLKAFPPDNAFRIASTEALLAKLYAMGLVPVGNSLAAVERIAASAFCRRRLPVVMVRLKFAETMREAVAFVEQGHIRVGPEVVRDPAYLVTRTFEGAWSLVAWVRSRGYVGVGAAMRRGRCWRHGSARQRSVPLLCRHQGGAPFVCSRTTRHSRSAQDPDNSTRYSLAHTPPHRLHHVDERLQDPACGAQVQ